MSGKAILHDTFVDLMRDLREDSEKLHQAEIGSGQRVWMAPANWMGDPFDIPNQHLPAFDRTEINQNYEELHTDKDGRVGGAASLKMQLDCTAVMERAFRSRHASSVRCQLHAAARHAGHGHTAGVFPRVVDYAQDLLKASGG